MLVKNSSYKKPLFWTGQHIETGLPNLFRKVRISPSSTEQINTPDGDFLEIDWYTSGANSLVILSHGLEGSTKSQYILGMARYLQQQGLDVLAWNYRGCGNEMNKKKIFYHSAATYDLQTIVAHAQTNAYKHIALVGFSLGGNLTLKYLAETNDKSIKCGVAFSTPVDLNAGCNEISKPKNKLYTHRFLVRLKKKLKRKNALMGDQFPINGVKQITDLRSFDNEYTAPLHGFKDANEYYQQASALYVLDSITTPTLLVNALNDPFLPAECYPVEQLKNHPYVWLETPAHGGHVGFRPAAKDGSYWSERRAFEFIKEWL